MSRSRTLRAGLTPALLWLFGACASPSGADAMVAPLDASVDAGAPDAAVCVPAQTRCLANARWCAPSFAEALTTASNACAQPSTLNQVLKVARCAPGRSAVTFTRSFPDPMSFLLLREWTCVYAGDGGLVGGVESGDSYINFAGHWEPECAGQTCVCGDGGCP